MHQGRRYDGVRIREEHGNVDERGNITDDAMLAKLVSVMGRANIELIMSGMRVDVYKALPDAKDQFINNFIDTTTGELKNAELLQRRIIGLTSYFKSAQEALMPAFDRDTNVHAIRLDMSSYQFGKYEEARVSERKQERNKPKKKKRQGGTGDVFDDSVSTYRIFSRAFCNFVFPPTIERPMPGNDSLEDVIANPSADEDIIDAASIKERMNNIDGRYTEDDRKNMTQDSSYNARIVNEETFGPVMSIRSFKNEDELIEKIHKTGYGLSSSIFGKDKKRINSIVKRMKTGNVNINDAMTSYAIPSLPYGGEGMSGLGKQHGVEGLRSYCRVKSIVENRFNFIDEPMWLGRPKFVESFLEKVVNFLIKVGNLKTNFNEKKGKLVVETCKFENLKKKEIKEGFKEAVVGQKTGKLKTFFNLGKDNDYRKLLSNETKKKMNLIFKEDLKKWSYEIDD